MDGSGNFVITDNVASELNASYFVSVNPDFQKPYEFEADDVVLSSGSYRTVNSAPLTVATEIRVPIPKSIAYFLKDRPRSVSMTLTLTASMPSGGGAIKSVVWDVTALFARSVFQSTRSHTSLTWQLLTVGISSIWSNLPKPEMLITVEWDAASWYEGENTYSFEVDASFVATDTEVRVDPDRVPILGRKSFLSQQPSEDEALEDDFEMLSLEHGDIV